MCCFCNSLCTTASTFPSSSSAVVTLFPATAAITPKKQAENIAVFFAMHPPGIISNSFAHSLWSAAAQLRFSYCHNVIFAKNRDLSALRQGPRFPLPVAPCPPRNRQPQRQRSERKYANAGRRRPEQGGWIH